MRAKTRTVLLLLALALTFCYFGDKLDWLPDWKLVGNMSVGVIGIWRKNDPAEINDFDSDTNSTIRILVWTHWWWPVHQGFLTECPRKNCFLTSQRHSLSQSHAIVFHSRTIDWNDLPKERFQNQSYVFSNWEPPYRTGGGFTEKWKKEYFNMTMTYRRDSDAYAPNGAIVKRRSPLRHDLKELASKKNKPIAWMVSNCHTPAGREVLVENLNKLIKIDIFGKCGELKCQKDGIEFSNPETCGSIFEQNYKFYLSFENHMCQDYISEKFFLRLQRYIVPIVLERRNFAHFIPEYGKPWFIAVDDFKTIAELSNYLLYLDKNMSAYYEYLAWHQHYETVAHLNSDTGTFSYNHWCGLCDAVAKRKKKKTLNVADWWWKDTCDNTYKLFHDYIWLCKLC